MVDQKLQNSVYAPLPAVEEAPDVNRVGIELHLLIEVAWVVVHVQKAAFQMSYPVFDFQNFFGCHGDKALGIPQSFFDSHENFVEALRNYFDCHGMILCIRHFWDADT